MYAGVEHRREAVDWIRHRPLAMSQESLLERFVVERGGHAALVLHARFQRRGGKRRVEALEVLGVFRRHSPEDVALDGGRRSTGHDLFGHLG